MRSAHSHCAESPFVPVFGDEMQGILTVLEACALEATPLIQAGQNQRQAGRAKYHRLRRGHRGAHTADKDIRGVKEGACGSPQQEVTGRE